MRWWWVLALVAWGCGGGAVSAELDAARAVARAQTLPLPSTWKPDVRIFLAAPALRSLARAALDARGPLTTTLGTGPLSARAEVVVTDVEVATHPPSCPVCVPLRVSLRGALTTPAVRGDLTATVTADVDLALRVDRVGDTFSVAAVLMDVAEVSVQAGPLRGLGPLSDGLREVVRQGLAEGVPEVTVARFDAPALPVAALRAVGAPGGVEFLMRTTSPTSTPVTTPAAGPTSFTVRVGGATLVGLAAREAFSRPPVGPGVIIEPRGLRMTGDALAVDVRAWLDKAGGCDGASWWRDYTVEGAVTLSGATMQVQANKVAPLGASEGAGSLEALAVVAESAVLGHLVSALEATVPAVGHAVVAGQPVSVRLLRLTGDGDDLVLRGRLDVGNPP